MPANLKPKAWNLKPELTAAPELWRGCQLMYAPAGSDFSDLSRVTSESSRSGAISRNATPDGFGALYNTGYIKLDRDHLGGKAAGTILAYVVPSAIDGNNAIISNQISGGDGSWCLWVDNTGFNTGNINCISFDPGFLGGASRRRRIETSTNSVAVGVPVAVLARSSVSGTTQVWIDGQNDSNGPFGSGDGQFTKKENTHIGIHGGLSSFKGTILMCAVWDRYLSDGEMNSVGSDPFAMLRPAGF